MGLTRWRKWQSLNSDHSTVRWTSSRDRFTFETAAEKKYNGRDPYWSSSLEGTSSTTPVSRPRLSCPRGSPAGFSPRHHSGITTPTSMRHAVPGPQGYEDPRERLDPRLQVGARSGGMLMRERSVPL